MGQKEPFGIDTGPEFSNPNESTTALERPEVMSDTHYVEKTKSERTYIGIEEIYPASKDVRPELGTAINLLNEATVYADSALEFLDNDAPMRSDDSLMKAHAVLPELFCCRSIGDGFANVIISLFHAIANANGNVLNRDQIFVIRKCLYRLKSEPFLSFEDSLGLVTHLEDNGLSIEPEYYEGISERLDE